MLAERVGLQHQPLPNNDRDQFGLRQPRVQYPPTLLKSILGDLDATKIIPILALRPTVADVEEASMWLGGDPDIFGAAEPLKGIVSQIVTILTADEEEEPPRAG